VNLGRPPWSASTRSPPWWTERRGGNREAFAELYRLFHPKVFRLAPFYLATAEDAVSETFVGLGRRLRLSLEEGAVQFLIGLSSGDLAIALGRSVGAVNALQWRPLRALQRRLTER
jgi:DNA-directed RNA polymerase specialized sigma24 family protein